jgi:hypothetical protein
MTDIAHLTPPDFEPLIGQDIVVSTETGEVRLKIDNIKHGSAATLRDNHLEVDGVVLPPRQAFALTLEGPREPILPSMMYAMQLPQMGELHLFLSAFRQDHNCVLYEITFS